jgi:hypothetical protein
MDPSQIIAAVLVLAIFYLYLALANVLMFVINFWPIVLFFIAVLAAVLFEIRNARNRDAS